MRQAAYNERRIRWFGLVLCITLVLTMWTGNMAAWAQDVLWAKRVMLMDGPVSGASTVRTTVHLPAGTRDNYEGVWLAGLTDERGGEPSVLSITYAPIDSGWLGPMWGIHLQSDSGVIPAALATRQGTGFLHGSRYLPLATQSLPEDHDYEIALGYDPSTGAAAVSIYDMTAGEWVVNRNLQLQPFDKPLYAAAGSFGTVGRLPRPVSVDMRVDKRLIPAPLSWWVMQRDPAQQSHLSTNHLNRTFDTIVSFNLPWERVPGTIVATVTAADGQLLDTVRAEAGSDRMSLSVADLPNGTYTVQLAYDTGDEAVPLDSRDITVGTLSLAIKDVHVSEAGADRTVVQADLHLETDAHFEHIIAGVKGTLIEHTFVMDESGLHGQTEQRTVAEQTLFIGHHGGAETSRSLRFSREILIPSGAADAGWELVLEPFTLHDAYALPSRETSAWLRQMSADWPWLGFLDNEDVQLRQWFPGVQIVNLRGTLPQGPIKMHLAIVDTTEPGLRLDTLIGSHFNNPDGRWARSQVGEMVGAAGALLGINAAFFDISNTMVPGGMIFQSGTLLKSGGASSKSIVIDKEGRGYIGQWHWQGVVQRSDGTASRPLDGLNERDMPSLGLMRWPMTRTPGTIGVTGVELVLEELGEEDMDSGQGMLRRWRGVVKEVHRGVGPLDITKGNAVLRGTGVHAAYLTDNFSIGDEVTVTYSVSGSNSGQPLTDWRDIRAAVTGNVILLRDGAYGDGAVLSNRDRHPRTAVAVSDDHNTVYLLVVEGRSANSIGMTYQDMADYFLYIGAPNALNLDGGGSSTLIARESVNDRPLAVNVTSDGSQRYVPDGLGVFYDAP